jgi:hypothetical protein
MSVTISSATISASSISGDGSGLTNITVSNLGGGSAGQIPYQTSSGVTSFVTNGTSGQILISNGNSAPSWQTASGGGNVYTAGAGLVLSSGQFSLAGNIALNNVYVGDASPIGDSSGFLIYNPSNQFSIYSPSSGQLIFNSQTGTTMSFRVGGYTDMTVQDDGSGGSVVGINPNGVWKLFALNVGGGAAFTASVNATNEIKVTNTSDGTSADCLVDLGNSTVESWFLLCGHGETNRNGAQYAPDRTLVEAREEDLALSTYNDKEISMWVNSSKRVSVTSAGVALNGLLDMSSTSASDPTMKVTATSDTPSTTYSSHIASNNPSGFVKIKVGSASKYLPYYD